MNARPWTVRTPRWRWIFIAGLLAWGTLGCEESPSRRTELFERAEQHYRRGEYDTALDQYQAFLEQYPRSELADTARLRIRSLKREVSSVLERKDMPQPNYIGGSSSSPDSPGPSTSNPSSPDE